MISIYLHIYLLHLKYEGHYLTENYFVTDHRNFINLQNLNWQYKLQHFLNFVYNLSTCWDMVEVSSSLHHRYYLSAHLTQYKYCINSYKCMCIIVLMKSCLKSVTCSNIKHCVVWLLEHSEKVQNEYVVMSPKRTCYLWLDKSLKG